MLWTIVWTSASVGAAVSSWCSCSGAWCPFGSCAVVPVIFLSPCCCCCCLLVLCRETLTEARAAEELGSPSLDPTLRPRRVGAWEPACSAGCGDTCPKGAGTAGPLG